jgi:4-amino-4-deoxy-L-arabinose transferase-like glycosyltransferase
MDFWQVLQSPQFLSGPWWRELWLQAQSYRGPLVYQLTTPLFSWLGPGFHQAVSVNWLFSGLLLVALYGLGRRLFNPQTGFWAAALSLAAPAFILQRTDYLLDFGLTAILTLTLLALAGWTLEPRRHERWGWAIASGVGLGLILLTRPTGVLFLWVPLLWLVWRAFRQGLARRGESLAQIAVSSAIALILAGPWMRTNWVTLISSILKAREWGIRYQPGLEANSWEGWLYYPINLPWMISWPVVVLTLVGAVLVFFRRNRWRKPWWPSLFQPETKPLRWLLSCLLGGLLLCVVNSSKDYRFVLPLLPVVLIVLARLLTILPGMRGQWIRRSVALVGAIAAVAVLFPVPGLTFLTLRPAKPQVWPHADLIQTVRQTAEHLQQTLGVLADTAEINAFNVNFAGQQRQFSVYGRQTIAPVENVQKDLDGFHWFLLKSGVQGQSIGPNHVKLLQAIATPNSDFIPVKRWPLPDRSDLWLFQRRELPVTAEAIPCSGSKISLQQITVPGRVPAGHSLPITYTLDGPAAALRQGLLLVNWQQPNDPQQVWIHDHGIALGQLLPETPASSCLRITERLGSLPPAGLSPGVYQPQVSLLNRQTGQVSTLASPRVQVQIDPTADPAEAYPLDPMTRLRLLGQQLEQGVLQNVSSEAGLIIQHDPSHTALEQTIEAYQARLRSEPDRLEWYYPLTLAQALKQDVDGAIATLTQLTGRLAVSVPNGQSLNPAYPWLYLGFVRLYNLQPRQAQAALDQASRLQPNLPLLRELKAAAAAMQLDGLRAWQLLRAPRSA